MSVAWMNECVGSMGLPLSASTGIHLESGTPASVTVLARPADDKSGSCPTLAAAVMSSLRVRLSVGGGVHNLWPVRGCFKETGLLLDVKVLVRKRNDMFFSTLTVD